MEKITTKDLIETLLISLAICKIYLETGKPKEAEHYLERTKRQWISHRPIMLQNQN